MTKEALHVVKELDKLNYSDELSILKHLTEKYNLKTVSEYFSNRQTTYNHIKAGKIPTIELMNQTFIIEM